MNQTKTTCTRRLNTTAGRCVYMRKGDLYKAHIELSPKVVDCLERLKETLAHELCHAATFIIDKKMVSGFEVELQ